MRRPTFLAASAATLAMPAIVQAQAKRVLRFIPQADLAVVDPIWTTAYVTRNHGFMVYDTLLPARPGLFPDRLPRRPEGRSEWHPGVLERPAYA
jgi:peptide/nickel transport system substrate-binding protein